MPGETISQKLDALMQRQQAALREVAKAAKSLLPILKDHNLTNTASELGEKLFQLDAIEGEVQNLVREDPEAFMDDILRRLKPTRP